MPVASARPDQNPREMASQPGPGGSLANGRTVEGNDDESIFFFENPPTPSHLASARQHPGNQKENQAGHSLERAVEGPGRAVEGAKLLGKFGAADECNAL